MSEEQGAHPSAAPAHVAKQVHFSMENNTTHTTNIFRFTMRPLFNASSPK